MNPWLNDLIDWYVATDPFEEEEEIEVEPLEDEDE